MKDQLVAIPQHMRADLSIRDIMNLDARLFSRDQKESLISELYGKPKEWSWKQDLLSARTEFIRWGELLSEDATRGQPYRISHRGLVERAKLRAPASTDATVTGFTDWLFRLYMPQRDYEALKRGARFEREIARKRVQLPSHGNWNLVFDGMNGSNVSALRIAGLAINGAAIWGKPDLVFREKKTGRILIVEIKVSECDIPSDGWPNMRAQLWAYSQIDQWQDAPEILLASEVWSYKYGVRRRKTIRFSARDAVLHAQNRELFDIYVCHALPATKDRRLLQTEKHHWGID